VCAIFVPRLQARLRVCDVSDGWIPAVCIASFGVRYANHWWLLRVFLPLWSCYDAYSFLAVLGVVSLLGYDVVRLDRPRPDLTTFSLSLAIST